MQGKANKYLIRDLDYDAKNQVPEFVIYDKYHVFKGDLGRGLKPVLVT